MSLSQITVLVCISLRNGLYPVAKWYIEDTALKFARPDFWNSGFFADTLEKWDCLRFIRVLFLIISSV